MSDASLAIQTVLVVLLLFSELRKTVLSTAMMTPEKECVKRKYIKPDTLH